jgi:hypothetical protein
MIGINTLTSTAIPMVDLTLRWAARQVGLSGAITLSGGLYDANGISGPLVRPVQIGEEGSGLAGLHRMRDTHRVDEHPEVEVTAALVGADDLQSRLAATHDVLADFLQHFGLIGPPHLRSDGAVLTRLWSGSFPRALAQWAIDNGVECP